MAILTHGSNLSLAPTLRPLVRQAGGTVAAAVDALVAGGFHAVQLDAALPGTRPRDLDARARRDLVALLTRRGMAAGGMDLFIPRRHYAEPAQVDRAMTATLAAIRLAADLGRLPLSLGLPVRRMTDDAKASLVETADAHGVRLAVHAEDQFDALRDWVAAVDLPALGAGLDPAAILARGGDPTAVAHGFGPRLAVARLDDLGDTPAGGSAGGSNANDAGEAADAEEPAPAGVRAVVGEGDLDLAAYRVALDLASRRAGPVVLDLRGLVDPAGAAVRARRAWDAVAFEA